MTSDIEGRTLRAREAILAMLPQAARDWILAPGIEGGFGDDPDDSGGATKWGISQAAYPEEDIANLTPERALFLFHRDYWTPIRGDELPLPVAVLLFDSAVNNGVATAVARFQTALRRLGLEDVRADGIVGPITIHGARLASGSSLPALLAEALSFRAVLYADIVIRKPGQGKFLRGWMKRTYLLQSYCMELA